jgi:hypothetical protein
LRETTSVRVISGAVMAIRIADFDQIGGFDERFALYFEETDFLRRIARAQKRIAYVPSAHCRHLYNQSAGADSHNAARAYAESEMLYLSKWYSTPLAKLIKMVERPQGPRQAVRLDGPIPLPAGDLVVEASPLASFETAAGCFATSGSVDLPSEVWSSYRSPVLYLRVIDRRSAEELATYARYRS